MMNKMMIYQKMYNVRTARMTVVAEWITEKVNSCEWMDSEQLFAWLIKERKTPGITKNSADFGLLLVIECGRVPHELNYVHDEQVL